MKIPRTEGRELKYHAIFIAAALVIVLITPLAIRSCFFSPFAVIIVLITPLAIRSCFF